MSFFEKKTKRRERREKKNTDKKEKTKKKKHRRNHSRLCFFLPSRNLYPIAHCGRRRPLRFLCFREQLLPSQLISTLRALPSAGEQAQSATASTASFGASGNSREPQFFATHFRFLASLASGEAKVDSLSAPFFSTLSFFPSLLSQLSPSQVFSLPAFYSQKKRKNDGTRTSQRRFHWRPPPRRMRSRKQQPLLLLQLLLLFCLCRSRRLAPRRLASAPRPRSRRRRHGRLARYRRGHRALPGR